MVFPCSNWTRPPAGHQKEIYQNSMIGLFVLSVLGLPANVLVVTLILREKVKKSTTRHLLLNLAIADLVNLLLIDTIAVLFFLEERHRARDIIVLTSAPKMIVNFTLTLISMERYNALVKTMSLVRVTKKKILVAIFVSWLTAVALIMPNVVHLSLEDNHTHKWCRCSHGKSEQFEHIFWSLLIVIGFVIPLVVIVFCYASILKGVHLDGTILGKTTNQASLQEKKSLVHILLTVTLLFIVCNVPTIGLMVRKESEGCLRKIIYPAICFLGSVTSCLNPFLYSLYSERHRDQVKNFFSCTRHENEDDIPPPYQDTKL